MSVNELISHLEELDERELLIEVTVRYLVSLPPELADAAFRAAILRWFSPELLQNVLGIGVVSRIENLAQETKSSPSELYDQLRKLRFAEEYPSRGYRFHDLTREVILAYLWEKEVDFYRAVSEQAAKYFARSLSTQREQSDFDQSQVDWLLGVEQAYHAVIANEQAAIVVIRDFLDFLRRERKLGTYHAVVQAVSEHAGAGRVSPDLQAWLKLWRLQEALANYNVDGLEKISERNQEWIQFFEGKLAVQAGDWGGAVEIWEELRRELERLPVDLAKTLMINLSFLYKDRGEWDKAVECFQSTLDVLEQVHDEAGIATTFNNLGFLYKDKDQWQEAEKYFQDGLNLFARIGDQAGMATTFNNLGFLYKDVGQWQEAKDHFQHGLDAFTKAGDQVGMAITLNNLGFLYKDKEQWQAAENYFQRGLDAFEQAGDDVGMASTLNNLGFLYKGEQEWQKAEWSYQRSLSLLEKRHDERRMADTYSYLGFLHSDKEEWEAAETYFRRSLEILEKMKDERGLAVVLNNQGDLYKHKGEYDKAVDNFQRSLKIVEAIGDEMNAATVMYQIAAVYEEMERYDEARALLEKVVAICDRVGHPDLTVRRTSREILQRIRARTASSLHNNVQ